MACGLLLAGLGPAPSAQGSPRGPPGAHRRAVHVPLCRRGCLRWGREVHGDVLDASSQVPAGALFIGQVVKRPRTSAAHVGPRSPGGCRPSRCCCRPSPRPPLGQHVSAVGVLQSEVDELLDDEHGRSTTVPGEVIELEGDATALVNAVAVLRRMTRTHCSGDSRGDLRRRGGECSRSDGPGRSEDHP